MTTPIEQAIRDIAQAQIDDQVQSLHDRIEQVAAAPVPLADADVEMIRGLIRQGSDLAAGVGELRRDVSELGAQITSFQQAMTEALAKLQAAKGGA